MLDAYVNHTGLPTDYALCMETMGDRIRMLRQSKDYSLAQLGALVGVSKSAVSQWELGQTANIKLQTFLRLLEVLGTKYEYLVFGASRASAPRGGAASRGKPSEGP
jgi:transcriptional regulator with XRE-family HTH domain